MNLIKDSVRMARRKTFEGTSQITLIVEAGVDPNHQTERCDHCGLLAKNEPFGLVKTCSHDGPLSLCQKCYQKAGNSVR